MIDIHQYQPETLVIAGVILGEILGTIVTALFCWQRWKRGPYLRGCTDTEKLIRARMLADRRDDTPLPESPVALR